MRSHHSRGFTLVELLVVIAIMTVIAVLAVKAFRKSRTEVDVDAWAGDLRNQVNAAAKRAAATGQPYVLDVRPTSVQYCQVVAATINGGPPWTTTQTTCPGPNGNPDVGPLVHAPADAKTALYATTADVALPGPAGTSVYAPPARLPLVTNQPLYIGRYATASSSFDAIMRPSPPLQQQAFGFTAYVTRSGTDEPNKHRRVVVYGASAKPRVIDNF